MTCCCPYNHGAGCRPRGKAGHYGDFEQDITTAGLEEPEVCHDVARPAHIASATKHGIKLEGRPKR